MSDRILTAWLDDALAHVEAVPRFTACGRVTRVIGQVVEVSPLPVGVGEVCRIAPDDHHGILAQVVGFHERGVLLMPLDETAASIRARSSSRSAGRCTRTPATGWSGACWTASAIRSTARARSGPTRRCALSAEPPNPLERARIREPLGTGVRAIDGLLTLGRGQRIGIFAGSGVGKSVLLGMIARHTTADVNVIALLGERGREVREFIERDLGPEGLRARWSWSRPATRRPSCAPPGRSSPRPSPSTSATGARRHADDGLGHARRHGLARDRAGGGRAADHEGLPALRLRRAAAAARARRHVEAGRHHRPLHRARRGRRLQRARRGRGALDPRRPHRALAPPRQRRSTSRPSTSWRA